MPRRPGGAGATGRDSAPARNASNPGLAQGVGRLGGDVSGEAHPLQERRRQLRDAEAARQLQRSTARRRTSCDGDLQLHRHERIDADLGDRPFSRSVRRPSSAARQRLGASLELIMAISARSSTPIAASSAFSADSPLASLLPVRWAKRGERPPVGSKRPRCAQSTAAKVTEPGRSASTRSRPARATSRRAAACPSLRSAAPRLRWRHPCRTGVRPRPRNRPAVRVHGAPPPAHRSPCWRPRPCACPRIAGRGDRREHHEVARVQAVALERLREMPRRHPALRHHHVPQIGGIHVEEGLVGQGACRMQDPRERHTLRGEIGDEGLNPRRCRISACAARMEHQAGRPPETFRPPGAGLDQADG